MLHLGPIWYHSEPSDVSYSENIPRPISWFGLFLQQNDSRWSILFAEFSLSYVYTANVFPMKTTRTGNYGVPAGFPPLSARKFLHFCTICSVEYNDLRPNND